MPAVQGNHQAQAELLEPRSQSILLVGPEGVGKHFAAVAAASHHADAIDVTVIRKATTDHVRAGTEWLMTAPIGIGSKVLVVDLDGAAAQVANILLKPLEEPGPDSIIIVSSSGAVPRTIESRCQIIRFGSLTEAETVAALAGAGIGGEDALRLARVSSGSPGLSLRIRPALAERPRVLQLALAMSRRDWGLIAKVVRGARQDDEESRWNEAALLALQLWLADVLGRSTNFYSAPEKYGLDRSVPHRQLARAVVLARSNCRPSLAVMTAVQEILR